MENNRVLKYFLGANSGDGFASLYDDFVRYEEGDFLWVIKGGPGCGKSSFMKKIGAAAENAGMAVEYIFCSGDPHSLDGVYLPEKRVGYVDGTAPHVIEVAYPAAAGLYLDLGRYYDMQSLRPRADELMRLNKKYKTLYAHAYTQLAAAAAVLPGQADFAGAADIRAVKRRAESAAAREFGKKTGSGTCRSRYLSAVTCDGFVQFFETAETLCHRIYAVDNEFGLAPIFLERLAELAKEQGIDMIECYDTLHKNQLAAVLLPELSLGFAASGGYDEWQGEIKRHIRLDAMVDAARLKELKPRLKSAQKLRRQMLSGAVNTLAQAKALHDELESIYNPHVDFESLYGEAERHVKLTVDK